MREGRTGRSLFVMPDSGNRAPSILFLPVILPPWIPIEDGFPLKTCGNNRRGPAGRTDGGLAGRTEGAFAGRTEGTASLSVMPARVSVIPRSVVIPCSVGILNLPVVILNEGKNLASRCPRPPAAGVWPKRGESGSSFPSPRPSPSRGEGVGPRLTRLLQNVNNGQNDRRVSCGKDGRDGLFLSCPTVVIGHPASFFFPSSFPPGFPLRMDSR